MFSDAAEGIRIIDFLAVSDLPPVNQVGSGVRIPTGEGREHGTETVHG